MPRKDIVLAFDIALLLLWVCGLVWLIGDLLRFMPAAAISYGIQGCLVVGAFSLVTPYGSGPRFLARMVVCLLLSLTLLDAFVISVTSVRLSEVLDLALRGGTFEDSLAEAGITIATPIFIVGAWIIVGVVGPVVARRVDGWQRLRTDWVALVGALFILVCTFAAEQLYAASHDREYAGRQATLPFYLTLFSREEHGLTVRLPGVENRPPLPHMITSAERPKNVVFILLESFRFDALNEEVTPNLSELARAGVVFDNAYSEGPMTLIVWSALFLERPPYAHRDDQRWYEPGGARPLRILKEAGYSLYVATSSLMSYKGFRDQLLGEEPLLDGEYFSYEGQKRERHKSDRLAVQQVQSWLRDPSFLSEPYFVLIQLDGTHYTYYFDEDSVIRRPYAEGIHPTQLKEADITLIHNRYLNSARAVDDRVGELLETIRASGSYDDTVIVVASDHGEGFKKGQFGHWTLDETIQHVPLLMKLPTVEPRRVKSLVSHRHIFPTLFDYLGIRSEGQESLGLRGKSLLPEWKGDGAVLTFDFRLKNADLTTPMFVARFAVARSETAMTFSPVAVYDRAGNRLQSALENTQWRKWIRQMGAR